MLMANTVIFPLQGIGESILMKAVCEATGRSMQQIKTDVTALGDLGDVAQASRGKQRTLGFMKAPPRLTVVKVFQELTAIAHMSGDKVQQRKVAAIKGLLVACQNSEAKYIIRALGLWAVLARASLTVPSNMHLLQAGNYASI
jgi:DNA ligase-1